MAGGAFAPVDTMTNVADPDPGSAGTRLRELQSPRARGSGRSGITGTRGEIGRASAIFQMLVDRKLSKSMRFTVLRLYRANTTWLSFASP